MVLVVKSGGLRERGESGGKREKVGNVLARYVKAPPTRNVVVARKLFRRRGKVKGHHAM